MPQISPAFDVDLHGYVGTFAADPLGFVENLYRWPVHGETGPDDYQRETLVKFGEAIRARKFNGRDPVLPIRLGWSTGHGTGKTTLSAWITHFIMATRPHCRGTITANTADQLEKKTWAAIREWWDHLLVKHWFEINARIMFRQGARATWFCSPQSCAEENSEAFAGQHAKGSTSFYIFDESSAIPDQIWDVAEGGLTDGEPMMFTFANPTRNTGYFYRCAFGDRRDRWDIQVIDARQSKFSNKALIQQWLADYHGDEEADFFRVRVRGLPPHADELQFIDAARVAQAGLNVAYSLEDEPLIAGVDVSGGGSAMTVCAFRKGLDARSIPPIVLSGDQTQAHDRQLVVAKLAQAIEEHQPAAMFVDMAYGSVLVERLRRLGYRQVQEVNFGAGSPDQYCENLRAYMWNQLREWLPHGAIDPKDTKLAIDLCGPGFTHNKRNKLVLEPKQSMVARGVASPDRADALALTWALPVRVPRLQLARPGMLRMPPGAGGWMGG